MKLNTIAVKTVFTLILVMSLTTETKSGVSNRDILVGASARAIGMGSAFTAGPASGDSFYWNASSLGFLNGMELSMVGLPFAENLTNREGAFSLGLNPQHLGIFDRKIGNISFASWFEGWGADRERNRTMPPRLRIRIWKIGCGRRQRAPSSPEPESRHASWMVL